MCISDVAIVVCRDHLLLFLLPQVCALGISICSGDEGWANLLDDTQDGGIKVFASTATEGSEGESLKMA